MHTRTLARAHALTVISFSTPLTFSSHRQEEALCVQFMFLAVCVCVCLSVFVSVCSRFLDFQAEMKKFNYANTNNYILLITPTAARKKGP